MTGPQRSAAHRFAREAALSWTLRITEGLPRRIAEERRAELVSDLWEHAAAAARAGQPQWRLALSVLMRTVRGIPADLTWRAGVLHAARRAMVPAAAAAAPMPLAVPLFDQTNGALVTDDMVQEDDDGAARLFAAGFASNFVNAGGGGAGW